MAITPIADYRADVRSQLQDAANWGDGEIDYHVQHAVIVFSHYIPYEQESILPVVDEDKEVDISSLTGRVYIRDVEFFPDRSTRRWRNWSAWGDYLTLGIDFDPDVTGSTLTGTVTFAATVDVTGSGTAFEDEVEAGDFIKNSADTEWAKVRSVTDDTNLVLARAYAGTTGADTVDTTPARTYKEVVRIYWGGMHAVAAAATTIPIEHEQLITDGACLYAKMGFLGKARDAMGSVISKVGEVDAVIGSVLPRVSQAVDDLASGRSYIASERGTALGKIEKMTGDISRAMDELAIGSGQINRVTVGSNVASGHANYSASQLSIGLGHLQQAAALMAQDQPAGEYPAYASGELSAAGTCLSQASAYLSEYTTSLNAASLIYSTQLREAQADLGLWLMTLRAKRTPRSFRTHSRSA